MGGRRGHPSKPVALKIRDGERRCRIPKHEPKPRPGVPEMPEMMSERARNIWIKQSKLLDDMGVLTEADAVALMLLCDTLALIQEARDIVQEQGQTYTANDLVKLHPAMGVISDCDRRARLWFSEFGLTPASRSRIAVAGSSEEEDDIVSTYFGAKQ